MEIVRCKNGHSYDPSVTPECPECARLKALEGTVPFESAGAPTWAPAQTEAAEDIGKTQPVHLFGDTEGKRTQPQTDALDRAKQKSWWEQDSYRDVGSSRNDFVTRPAGYGEGKDMMPVVGWLVCISGPSKGQDYRIHSDNNYIGRAAYMDIAITGDDTISRENHAILAYDTREKLYYFAPGSGRGIVRLNGKAVLMMTELHAYDKIEIGRSILIFVPLCGEKFSWEELED